MLLRVVQMNQVQLLLNQFEGPVIWAGEELLSEQILIL